MDRYRDEHVKMKNFPADFSVGEQGSQAGSVGQWHLDRGESNVPDERKSQIAEHIRLSAGATFGLHARYLSGLFYRRHFCRV
jgi:hypothetical protein